MKSLHLAAVFFGTITSAWAQTSFIPEAPPITHPEPAPLPATPAPEPETPEAPAPMVAASLSSMTSLDNTTKLRIGDTISFRVIEDRDAPLTRLVTDSGEIEFPYVGRLKAEGKTCRELAEELKKVLEKNYYEHATVIIGIDHMANQMTPHDYVWIIGEGRSVGPQQISPSQPMTLSQIILKAGGFGPYADERHVRLVHNSPLTPSQVSANPDAPVNVPPAQALRDPKNEQIVDVKAVLDGKSATDPVVSPGDYIIIKKRFINF